MHRAAEVELRKKDEDEAAGVEATYKAREVEGALDLLLYRPLGFRLARFFAGRAIAPSQVTLLATIAGVAAGHLYVYEALWLNLFGMVLHVGANLLDNVDGQLARLTHQQSEEGRVLDGVGDNLVFASVYVHLCIRHVHAGGSELVWLLALAAGVCHSIQSAAAEFCRDAFARFGADKATRLYTAHELRQRASGSAPWKLRALRALHAGYLAQQEFALRRLAQLRDRAAALFPERVPGWFAAAYRASHERLVRHARLLGTNTRMLMLFVVLFLRQPTWYFIAELTIFNALFCWLVLRQNSLAAQLLRTIDQRRDH